MCKFSLALVMLLSTSTVLATEITVDFESLNGRVKPVNGVGQPPMQGMPANPSLIHYLKEAGIPYARLHDVGGLLGGGVYVDIPNVFPDFNADESIPENYDFAFTDGLIANLKSNGIEPFYRLGVTIENFVRTGIPHRRAVAPPDYAKWSRICEHVIRHYNEGWADGFHHGIVYWEIWNEPDNEPDEKTNPMWNAPFSEYIRLYGVVATHLKSRFPKLKIGGYGSCGFYAAVCAKQIKAANSSPRTEYFVDCAKAFLSEAKSHGWPLDFFSFHSYSDAADALTQVAYADQLLNEYGFTPDRTERIFNEWLPTVSQENLGTAKQAAQIAAELIGLQNGPCDMACIYDARCGVGNYSPLFNPMTYKPHKAYYVYMAFNELRKLGFAVKVTADDAGLSACSAKEGDDAAILVANISGSSRKLALSVGEWSVSESYVIDENRTYVRAAVPNEIQNDSVWLFRLKPQHDKVATSPAGIRTVSPDGGVEAEFSLTDGQPSVAFSCGGVAVGRMTVGPDLGLGDFKVLKTASDAHRGSWKPAYGFRSEYPDDYSELTVFLSCGDSDARRLQVTVRAYDEGIAVRYSFVPDVYCEAELKSERTAIFFPVGSVCWGIRETEGCYPEEPVAIGSLDRSADWYMPLTLRTPEGIYASVLEANTVAWPRSVLRADGQGAFSSRFVRGSMIGRGNCTSPWRAVLLAPDAKGLIERSYFVWNLNDSCALMDTGWIKPGLTVSDLGNCELRMSEVIAAARAAKAVGARYLQLDWGWYGTEYPWTDADRADYLARYPDRGKDTSWFENTKADPYTPARGFVPYHPTWPGDGKRTGVDLDMPKLIAEMDGIGIGLCLYVHGLVLERTDLDRLFATYASWGVAGLKPGFVSFGSQQATDWLRNLAATAAKHRLWLDIHDQQIPDGFERTWPNVMINEGGGGAEWPAYPPHHELVHPFTRCLAGAFDYTPVFFTTNRTHAHSAAFCICYPGPTAVLRGKVGNLSSSDPAIVEFLKELPWTYDETRVLDGEIAQRLVVARRKGDRWFLGGMSGVRAQDVSVGTDWLEPGVTYELKAVTDAGTDVRMLRRGDPLRVRMSSAGGFVSTVTPVRTGRKGK